MKDEEVIKILKTILGTVFLGNLKFIDAVKYAIYALEKRDSWIPVTEKLPEEGENVLGWIERDKWDRFDTPTKAEECAIGWQIEGRWHFDGYASRGTKCIAWRPLPEPYTAGKQT